MRVCLLLPCLPAPAPPMTFPYSNYKGAGEKLAKGGGLQQAVVVNGIVHIAGQGGVNDNVELLSDGKAQIRQACLNAGKAVEAAGAMGGLKDIFKMTVYTTDMPLMKTAGVEVLRELWDDSVPPVTIIGVASLWFEGMHIEVDAQALIR